MCKQLLSKIVLTIMCAIGHIAALEHVDHVEKVNQKWMNLANDTIADEKKKLFKDLNISADIIELLETNEMGKLVPEVTTLYDAQTPQHILDTHQNTEDKIFKLAQSIFSPEYKNIKIIYNEQIPNMDQQIIYDPIRIVKHYGTNTCLLYVDKSLIDAPENILADVLRHEKAHALYDDVLEYHQINFILAFSIAFERGLAPEKNGVPQDILVEVSKMAIPYYKAKEIRADVYCALTSPCHGDGIQELLLNNEIIKFSEEIDEANMSGLLEKETACHPSNLERIGLFQKISEELRQAERDNDVHKMVREALTKYASDNSKQHENC